MCGTHFFFFLWNKEVLDKGACVPTIIIRNMSCTAITEGSEKTRYTHYYGKDFFLPIYFIFIVIVNVSS